MDFKKKLKRFFTLTHKANDGFTLVELIVVIAILAILAGVGSVGYAGYIKSANKGADKTLVGNVMRAIETGTNSYAFVNDDSFKLGKMSYPVGFVVLSKDGAKIVTSETEKVPGVAGECEFETISGVAIVTSETKTYTCDNAYYLPNWILFVGGDYLGGCPESRTETIYTIQEDISITYCKTHLTNDSLLPSKLSSAKTYLTGVNTANNSCEGGYQKVSGEYVAVFDHTWGEDVTKTLAAGTPVTSSLSGLYTLKSDGKCEYAYANQNATFRTETNIVENTTSGELYDSLVAAFGSDLSALKLKYDGWTSEEGIDFATFYLTAPELMEDIEELSGLLAFACIGGETAKNELGLKQVYDSSEEVLTEVSSGIVGTHTTEDSWMNAWRKAANETWGSYGFELEYREEYSAARTSYNNAFASYVSVTDKTVESKYVELIKDFKSQEALGVGLPGLVNTSAFTDDASGLKEKFVEAGDTNAGEDGSAFNKCAALFETYKNSPACEENGKLIYGTIATFDETADVANAYSDLNGGTIYDYYNNYVKEINALYEAAQTAAGDGIVIIVTVEDGLLNFVVSPNAANPRNK